MCSDRGLLVVLSGPSGVGKSTVANKLMQRAGYRPSISVTTRAPRPGEVAGQDYTFVDRERFLAWKDEQRFLESAEVHGNLYGTLRQPVAEAVAAGDVILLVIDVQGGESVRSEQLPQLLVFLEPPSWQVLEQRLRGRATDDDEAVQRRLQNARRELELAERYDAVVVNDSLEASVAELHRVIEEARHGRDPSRCDG